MKMTYDNTRKKNQVVKARIRATWVMAQGAAAADEVYVVVTFCETREKFHLYTTLQQICLVSGLDAVDACRPSFYSKWLEVRSGRLELKRKGKATPERAGEPSLAAEAELDGRASTLDPPTELLTTTEQFLPPVQAFTSECFYNDTKLCDRVLDQSSFGNPVPGATNVNTIFTNTIATFLKNQEHMYTLQGTILQCHKKRYGRSFVHLKFTILEAGFVRWQYCELRALLVELQVLRCAAVLDMMN